MSDFPRREPTSLYFRELYEQNKRLEEKIDELIRVTVRLADVIEHTAPEKELVYGIPGLQDLLNCSKSTANRIKATGILDPAISQTGKTIIIDAEKALELLRTSKSKWAYLANHRLK